MPDVQLRSRGLRHSFGEVNEGYGAFFESDPPARVAFGVAALPRGAQVEIDAVMFLG